jgi:hypothetical protein
MSNEQKEEPKQYESNYPGYWWNRGQQGPPGYHTFGNPLYPYGEPKICSKCEETKARAANDAKFDEWCRRDTEKELRESRALVESLKSDKITLMKALQQVLSATNL